MGQPQELASLGNQKVKPKAEVVRQANNDGGVVNFASLMKQAELAKLIQR